MALVEPSAGNPPRLSPDRRSGYNPPMSQPDRQPRRLLVIAYYYPPLGMGGVKTVIPYVRYLADYGWRPEVLTV